jgi:predicted MFS family arabinose efflux permease
MGIYGAGTQLGSAFGYLLGGWLFYYLGWRNTFVAVGVPGLLLSLLVFGTVREPVRGAIEARSGVASQEHQEPLRTSLLELWRNRTFAWLQVGAALHAVAGYGLAVWMVPFMIRVHGLEVHVIGTALGLIGLAVGIPGVLLGGFLCDRLAVRDARWYLWIPTLGALVGIPFTVSFLFLPDPTWALAAYSIHAMMNLTYVAPVFALMQGVVRLRMRSLAVAVHLFIANLVGLGLGPVIVGGFNDLLRPSLGDEAIRYTMLLAAVTNVAACAFYLLAARTVKQDLKH